MQKKRTNRRKRGAERRGAAMMEFAVCLPVLVLIVFASIEAASMIFTQQALQTAAYEVARHAIDPRATSTSALARGSQVLADRGISSGVVTLDPTDMFSTARGTPVIVTASAPFEEHRLMPEFFYGNEQLTAQVTMLKE